MRILFLGDVVAQPGRDAVAAWLPPLKRKYQFDAIVLNGENAAHGVGINSAIAREFFDLGVNVITMGNHLLDQSEAWTLLQNEPRLLRPANYSSRLPGKGHGIFNLPNGKRLGVINLSGVYAITPSANLPADTMDGILPKMRLKDDVDALIIDFHAEATAEKIALGHAYDGKASLIIGTHTHIPTQDAHILTGGTAFMSDAGMCGCYDSVIGVDKAEPVNRFFTQVRQGRFTPAKGKGAISGVILETSDATGLAVKATPIIAGEFPYSQPVYLQTSAELL